MSDGAPRMSQQIGSYLRCNGRDANTITAANISSSEDIRGLTARHVIPGL
jgi:hypothetical protein